MKYAMYGMLTVLALALLMGCQTETAGQAYVPPVNATPTGPIHPADADADYRIELSEVATFARNASQELTDNAVAIWRNGEEYQYDDYVDTWIPVHPADANYDFKISIGEVTSYGQGHNAVDIYRNGEVYTWANTTWIPRP